MSRGVFFFVLTVACCLFWSWECVWNYLDYLGDSPIFLKPDYLRAFETNRLKLIAVELLVPFGMAVFFLILTVMHVRGAFIKWPLLLLLFLSSGYWFARTFVFPDRMVRYYQMSDPERYADRSPGEIAGYLLAVFVILWGLVFLYPEPKDPSIPSRYLSKS